MRGFGEYLNQARRPEWSEHYLDYSSMKKLLSQFYERRSKLNVIDSSNDVETFITNGDLRKAFMDAETSARKSWGNFSHFETNDTSGGNDLSSNLDTDELLSRYEREEFCYALDQQMDRITSFYLTQVAFLNHELASTNLAVKKTFSAQRAAAIEERGDVAKFKAAFNAIGDEVLELYVFVTANIAALNQALIRFDGLIRLFDGPPLAQWYCVTRREGYFGKNFHSFLSYEALPRISRELMISFEGIYVKRNQNVHNFLNSQTETDDNFDSNGRAFTSKLFIIESYLGRAEQALGKAKGGRNSKFFDRLLYTLQYYFVAGSHLNDIILQPGFMKRGENLTKEIKFCAKWRRNGGSISDANEDMDKTSQLESLGPLLINLLSQVLYMCNHYIVEPSSTKYIHELGGHDALSGLLIGMTPWAAVFSAFIYSMWSNHSFKQPLICSGIMLASGSIVYASASKFHSIPVAMAGRILTGLGGPCAINRRYIADTVPSNMRTAVSASFATASAFGMSMGPGLAIALDLFDFDLNLPLIGKIEVNGMTAPGYFMFICWVLYLVLLICQFEEQERTGLQELKEKEERSRHEARYQPPPEIDEDHKSGRKLLPLSDSASYEESDDDDGSATSEDTNFRKPSKRYVNQATVVCMSCIFLGKFVLEGLNSSNSIVTRHRYDWSVKNIGTLGLLNGMLIVPISTAVGFLSQRFTDWMFAKVLLACGLFGVFILVDVTDFGVDPNDDGYNHDSWASVGPWRFVAGQLITFSGLNAFESISMSMLSKVVPFELAKGTFNAGFLTSVFATLGRACGDAFITLMGLISLRNLLNLLAIPCLFALFICLALLRIYRHKLLV